LPVKFASAQRYVESGMAFNDECGGQRAVKVIHHFLDELPEFLKNIFPSVSSPKLLVIRILLIYSLHHDLVTRLSSKIHADFLTYKIAFLLYRKDSSYG